MLENVPPKRSWKVRLAKVAAWMALVGASAAALAGLLAYYHFSKGLPEIPKVEEYWPPILSEVYTDDAVLAGEFYNERRKVVPYERIPKRLVQAFIASEDASFFDHMGVDFVGTTRAVIKTVLKKTRGTGSVQGGSTLTQQTAKAVLALEIDPETGRWRPTTESKSYRAATERRGMAGIQRKIREAIMAYRLERQLTKEQILYLYLNNVYLGHHSYGVQAAAENYFRKDVRDLSLAEMSLIAGLPQAPSRYSPFLNPEAAKTRRAYVLRRMLEEGMISKQEHDEARDAQIGVYPVEDVFHEFAPYFVEQVRKDVVDRYGNDLLLNQGLRVFTTMDAEKQRAAQDAMLDGLLAVDKRQGWRGPLARIANANERAAFIARSKEALGNEKLQQNSLYVGLVTAIAQDGLSADVQVGPHKGLLPLLGMHWAHRMDPQNYKEVYYPSGMIESAKKALAVGDVIVVRAVSKKDLTDDKEQYDKKLDEKVPDDGTTLFRLEQEPELQSALVSIDPHRHYLVAMVGGYDFDANEYNRAFQACRQPGSSFKPFVYSAAIELLDWTEGTIIVDSPVVENDPEHQVTWKPENYTEDFKGDVLLRTAMVNSMNIPAIKTFVAVSIKNMTEWVQRFGITTKLNPDYSAALGSSCVYPFELAQAYATFNRLGLKHPTHFIRKIEDRFGRTLEDHTAYDDAWAPFQDRVAAGYARLFEPGEQVMSRETGFILTDLLRGVVKEGTGAPAQRLGKPAAGKTGTTNDSFDAWFAGFTKDLVSVAWVGYDLNPHPLGRFETGGRAALPIWLAYMKDALSGRPQGEFYPPRDLLDDLVKVKIDTRTGKVAAAGSKTAEDMWFKKDTEPRESEPEKGKVDQSQFFNTQ